MGCIEAMLKVAPCAPASATGGLAKAVQVGVVAGEQVAGAALAEALLLGTGEAPVRGHVAAPERSDPRRAGVGRRRGAGRRAGWRTR